VNRDSYARQLRHAAADSDWQRAERLGRAYGWSLLGSALRAGLSAIGARAARWAAGRRRRVARR
jgi:hypothetical protein